MSHKDEIGFIGVGRMGGFMAARLVSAGFRVTVFDTNRASVDALVQKGASIAGSPAEVASVSDIVIASLPTPQVAEQVALGLNGIIESKRAKIFVDCSTTGATCAKRIAAGLKARDIIAVDAPVSGGVGGAEKGTLALIVSCPDGTLVQLRPVLEHLGKIFHVGKDPGQGQTMKLLNNLLSAASMSITSEAVVMGVKAGLDPRQMIDVINSGTGRNGASEDKFKKFVIPRNFNQGFALGLLSKDLHLCMEEAEALHVPMMVGGAVRQLVAIARAKAGDQGDMTEIIKPIEEWAGVVVGDKNRD